MASKKKTSKTSTKTTSKKSTKKSTEKKASSKSSKKSTKKAAKKTEKSPTEKREAVQEPVKADPGMQKGTLLTIIILLVALVGITIFFLLQEGQQNQDPVLVMVNGEPITLNEVRLAYERLPADLQALYTPELILNQTIDKVLLIQYAKDQGITVTEADVDAAIEEQAATLGTSRQEIEQALETSGVEFSEFEDAVEEELYLRALLDDVVYPSVTVTDQEVQNAYTANVDRYTADPNQIRVRHILVETEEEAQQVYDLAVSGEDFAQLAMEYSIGPTGPDGGDLGFISDESPLVEPFKSVALDLSVGEVSQPVETQYGWHVIYRDSDVIPYSAVEEEIRNQVRDGKAREAFTTLLVQLRADADITRVSSLEDFGPQPLQAQTQEPPMAG